MDRAAGGHDDDFHAWTGEQAAALRRAAASGSNLPIDWHTIAEELDDMGRSQRAALAGDLARIVEHLLKLEHSPARDPRGVWGDSVVEHRGRVEFLLDDSPSLRPQLASLLGWAWRHAARHARRGLRRDGIAADAALPPDCPYTLAQILDHSWWPDNRHGLGREPD